MARLLVDISNSFTKVARADGEQISKVLRCPTSELTAEKLQRLAAGMCDEFTDVTFCSVVPQRSVAVRQAFFLPMVEVGPQIDLGIGIRYPDPSAIGPDRLANSVACAMLIGVPAVVVDFGTAVTFDVLSENAAYIGGVIAPGLPAMTDYLHEKTALLPRIEPSEPARTIGKSTREAMLAGTVFGYRGLIREIVERIRNEAFAGQTIHVVATGGHAELIAGGLPLFDSVDPLLTLRGLNIIAARNHHNDP
jgi:type III pantothenate kinase